MDTTGTTLEGFGATGMSARPTIAARKSRTRRRRLAVWLSRIGVVLLALVVTGTLWESAAEASDRADHPAPGRMVDVGGYSLHLDCVGSGSPTVVIDAGLGDWSTTWKSRVQPSVARTTRVCTYDRAGAGWSDPSPLPRTTEHFVRELHTLLQRAAVPGPYVLVGHSLGGLTVRVFADEYPADVAGVVLVDSMHPAQATHAGPPAGTTDTDRGVSIPVLAARIGLLRLLAAPLQLREGLAPEVADAYVAKWVTPRSFQTSDEETANVGVDLEQAAAVASLGDLPLIVLSRGQDSNPDWDRNQADLLRLSSRSRQLIAKDSGHIVQIDEPEAASDAIVEMIDELRSRGS